KLEINADNKQSDSFLKSAAENLSVNSFKTILDIYPIHQGKFLLYFLSHTTLAEKDFIKFVSDYIDIYKNEILNFSNSEKITLLMAASKRGYPNVVKSLLAAGVNVHRVDSNGKSALYLAGEQAIIFRGKNHENVFIKIIELLLKNGAEINTRYEI